MNAVKELKSTADMSQNKFATHDGYIKETLSPMQVDAIRQIQATLSIEELSVTEGALSMMKRMASGEISYDDAIADLRNKYQNDEKY